MRGSLHLIPNLEDYRITRKATLLNRVRCGVITLTTPVVAPPGTVAVISELETTLNTATTPLNVTLLAPVRLFPRILMSVPTLPQVGCVFTNGARPTDRLTTVPPPSTPPKCVAPYKSPFVAWTRPGPGGSPS